MQYHESDCNYCWQSKSYLLPYKYRKNESHMARTKSIEIPSSCINPCMGPPLRAWSIRWACVLMLEWLGIQWWGVYTSHEGQLSLFNSQVLRLRAWIGEGVIGTPYPNSPKSTFVPEGPSLEAPAWTWGIQWPPYVMQAVIRDYSPPLSPPVQWPILEWDRRNFVLTQHLFIFQMRKHANMCLDNGVGNLIAITHQKVDFNGLLSFAELV